MNGFILAFFSGIVLSHSVFAGSIATFNIRNFGKETVWNASTQAELKRTIEKMDVDILAVQEIVNINLFNTFINNHFPKYQLVFSACGGGGSQKIGVLFDSNKYLLQDYFEDNSINEGLAPDDACGSLRPLLVVNLKNKSTRKNIKIMAVHLKAGSGAKNYSVRWKQYKKLSEILKEHKNKLQNDDYIVLGDFNTTGFLGQDQDHSKFQKLITDNALFDSGSEIQCSSYWSGENRSDDIEEASILDHLLLSDSLSAKSSPKVSLYGHCEKVDCANVSARELGSFYKNLSDHCPQKIEFLD